MHYVISDLHGCYQEFMQLLDQIQFSENDILYVIGDVIDRGPDPVKILQYMMMRSNVIPIIGNHEYIAMRVLPGLFQEVKQEDLEQVLTAEFIQNTQLWFEDGGRITAEQIRKLPLEEQEDLIEFIRDFSVFEELEINGTHYILIHSLPKGYQNHPDQDFVLEEMLFSRPDFHGKWDGDTTYIVGHTPTFKIGEEYRGKIFRNGRFIDIDCGCVTGNALGILCLETGEEYYLNPSE